MKKDISIMSELMRFTFRRRDDSYLWLSDKEVLNNVTVSSGLNVTCMAADLFRSTRLLSVE